MIDLDVNFEGFWLEGHEGSQPQIPADKRRSERREEERGLQLTNSGQVLIAIQICGDPRKSAAKILTDPIPPFEDDD